MTYFTTMSFWKKIKSILTLIGDISWIYIIKPLQKSVCVFIRCHVISKAIESTIERVITAVYFPSRKDPRLFKLSLNDKFGTEGGDYKKKIVNGNWCQIWKEKRSLTNSWTRMKVCKDCKYWKTLREFTPANKYVKRLVKIESNKPKPVLPNTIVQALNKLSQQWISNHD